MTKWIKCSERPPPDDREVLTYTGEYFSVGTMLYEEVNKGTYFFAGCGPIWNVTHWAELPEAP